MRELLGPASVISLVVLISSSAVAQNNSFKGKTLFIQVGASTGGGSSYYAQAVARHIGRHIPGEPHVVVQHVPGAGGLLVANNLYNSAPKDGSVIAITSRAFVTAPLIGNSNARYDPRKFGWLGSGSVEYSVCFSRQGATVQSFGELRTRELIVGAAGNAGTASIFAEMANKLAGTHIKTIAGYPGSTEVVLGLERGEIDGYCGLSWTYIKLRKPEWIRDHKINILFQMGPSKHPDLMDVPFLPDLTRSAQDRAVVEFLLIPQTMGRPFFAPPGLPDGTLGVLRSAFEATTRDPAFLGEAEKMKLEVEFVSGADAQAIVQRLHDMPDTVIREATKLMGSGE
jgi:tripartite-type tricarboxylate transporter receptor subunit TctC